MKTFIILFLLSALMLSGCSNQYKVVKQIKSGYEIENEPIILSHKQFNPSKIIFRNLRGDLSDNFVYIFSWSNDLPLVSNRFTGLIYDQNSDRKFYLSNTILNKKLLQIKESSSVHNEEEIILDYYLKNKIDSLTSLPQLFSSSEAGASYTLFDTKKRKAYVIDNLILGVDGKVLKSIR